MYHSRFILLVSSFSWSSFRLTIIPVLFQKSFAFSNGHIPLNSHTSCSSFPIFICNLQTYEPFLINQRTFPSLSFSLPKTLFCAFEPFISRSCSVWHPQLLTLLFRLNCILLTTMADSRVIGNILLHCMGQKDNVSSSNDENDIHIVFLQPYVTLYTTNTYLSRVSILSLPSLLILMKSNENSVKHGKALHGHSCIQWPPHN